LALEYTNSSSSKKPPPYLHPVLCCPWGRRSPHPETVDVLLHLGANPNQSLGEATVWQKYLILIAGQDNNADPVHLHIIERLLRYYGDPMAKCINVSARGVAEPVSDMVRYVFLESDEKRSLQETIETINRSSKI